MNTYHVIYLTTKILQLTRIIYLCILNLLIFCQIHDFFPKQKQNMPLHGITYTINKNYTKFSLLHGHRLVRGERWMMGTAGNLNIIFLSLQYWKEIHIIPRLHQKMGRVCSSHTRQAAAVKEVKEKGTLTAINSFWQSWPLPFHKDVKYNLSTIL